MTCRKDKNIECKKQTKVMRVRKGEKDKSDDKTLKG